MQKQNTSEKRSHETASGRQAAGARPTTAPAAPGWRGAYRPEVEARRADYEQLAEALRTMLDLEVERVVPLLDVKTDTGPAHLLHTAADQHLRLAYDSVDWYSADALKLYVEIRLLGDQQTAARRAYTEENSRGREGDRPREDAETNAAQQRSGDADHGGSPAHTQAETLTTERITELVDSLVSPDAADVVDEKARALIELLQGISDAADRADRYAVEDILLAASHRAYPKTLDFQASLDEFAGRSRDD